MVGWHLISQCLPPPPPPPTQMEIAKVGYMPILQAPEHEFDTLNAVVKRFMHVSVYLDNATQ